MTEWKKKTDVDQDASGYINNDVLLDKGRHKCCVTSHRASRECSPDYCHL